MQYLGHAQESPGGLHGEGIVVLVRDVHHLAYAALDDHLRTLVAGEQRHIHLHDHSIMSMGYTVQSLYHSSYRAVVDVGRVLVEDRIHLRVTHILHTHIT